MPDPEPVIISEQAGSAPPDHRRGIGEPQPSARDTGVRREWGQQYEQNAGHAWCPGSPGHGQGCGIRRALETDLWGLGTGEQSRGLWCVQKSCSFVSELR